MYNKIGFTGKTKHKKMMGKLRMSLKNIFLTPNEIDFI
jgi:hypothetical protein